MMTGPGMDKQIDDGQWKDHKTVRIRTMDNSEDIRPRMGDDNRHKKG